MTAVLEFDVFHEAGHAVIAHILGVPISRVTLHGLSTRSRPQDQANQAIVAYAGPIAEDRHRRYSVEQHRQMWAGAEWRADLVNAVRYLGDGDPKLALAQARQLVNEHWPSIELLAAALLARETLTGDEIAALLGSGGSIH